MSRVHVGWRTVAWAGVVLGVVAAFVAIPPISIRSPVLPIVIGLVAMTVGLGSWFRGERRVGSYAIVVGLLGLVIGYLATRSSLEKLEAVVVWGALLASMFRFATPLIFAALGGLFSERSGVVNIGLEGMMLMGCFFAVWGADVTGHWTGGLAIGIAAGGVTAFVHAFFSVSLRADQIVSGTAINFLALGITSYLFIKLYSAEGTPGDLSSIPDISLGFFDSIPLVGSFLDEWLGDLDLLIWLGLLSVVLTWVVVFRTPIGLRIRSVGEHPRAADTVGINVYAIRYGAVTLSGMLAAAGGAYLALGFVNAFTENMTAGRGFIALAAMIFGNWKPIPTAIACLLFGFSSALARSLGEYSASASVLFEALPYVLTIIAVAGVIGRSTPPAADGRPYVKQ